MTAFSVPEEIAKLHALLSDALTLYYRDFREDIPNEGTLRRWYDGPPGAVFSGPGFLAKVNEVRDAANALRMRLLAQVKL